MASKIKVDQLETADGSGTIALQNQLSGMTTASLPTLTSAELPAGSVLQVVQFSNVSTGHITTTSTSYVTTGISKAITPKRNNSIIIVETNSSMADASGTDSELHGKIKINGTDWSGAGTYALGYQYKPTGRYAGLYFTGNHTVSSLSTLTFEVFFKSQTGGTATWAHLYGSTSMTLTEIAQ